MLKKILGSNEQQKVEELKILTPKQMLQRLKIAFTQVKAGNTSENLLNQIRQIIYSLYHEKEVTKKLYSSIMNSIHMLYKMDNILLNSKSSETFDPHRLMLNFADRINLKRSDKYVHLSNISIYYVLEK